MTYGHLSRESEKRRENVNNELDLISQCFRLRVVISNDAHVLWTKDIVETELRLWFEESDIGIYLV